ncbi:MAG TPA: ATP-binding protein [Bryobacteraceae bacterium]|jgi:two-component system sensor histidine kinase CpxA|nr:ATP-binding protein [Bryobacteraceae bacterium]
MRSFFVQLFLSFWISTLITFVLAAMIFPSRFHGSYEANVIALETSLVELGRLQVFAGNVACRGPQDATLIVLDEHQRPVCQGSLPKPAQQLAADAQQRQQAEYVTSGRRSITAQPFRANGKTYIAVLITPAPPRSWFPHFPPWVLPVSVLVTFVLAYLLTGPVRALRAAFRRFASGDMSVRLPVSRSALRDLGGADIRTLMIDFNEMADRIQALIEAHRTLLRDVSHELRSPLARLNVALELAREEAPDAKTSLDRAELESSRLNALIGELLSLSSMEALHNLPTQKRISLADLVDELMPDLTFEAEVRGCKINHHNFGACFVMGSEDLLRRALENVIRNAIRYSQSGAEVTIETQQEESNSVLRVSDTGPGVPEESLHAIFRPFYRVDSARQSTTGGFGVGLAIADRAIELHGGSIRAFNRPQGGLTVQLTLPCAGAANTNAEHSAVSRERSRTP